MVMWRHMARKRGGQDDAAELAAAAVRLDRSAWPWPVVALFLGNTTTVDVMREPDKAATQRARADQSCEASFYVGVYASDQGRVADARSLLESAAKNCPPKFAESTAARLELQRLARLAGEPAKAR
jgi:lipoprotein NlpI